MSLEGWKTTFEIIGVALLFFSFLAGAGALIFSNKVNAVKDEQLRQFNKELTKAKGDLADAVARGKDADARILEAQRGATEANTKAEGFRLDIAKANESARKAEAQAAASNLELARFKAPRKLSPSQQMSIAARLRPFGAKRVDVIIIGDAREIAEIAGAIMASLREAGWAVKAIGKAISGPNVSGVLIGTHIGSDSGVNAAADALISALQSEGIISARFTPQFDDKLPMAIMGEWDEKNVAPIRILVSAKP